MKRFVYINGRVVSEDKAAVSVFDYGLLYGIGVFETMRAYDGRVFKLEEHMKRLKGAASAAGIHAEVGGIPQAIHAVLAKNRLSNAYVRVTLTYGVGKPRLMLDGKTPTVIVFAGELPKGIKEKQRNGMTAGFSTVVHYSKSPLARIKSTNYLQTALRKQEAKEWRLDDVIVVNEKNRVVEASTSNVFMVDGSGTLITPPLKDGCLPGITRKTVLEIAKKNGVKILEGAIAKRGLLKAREVFMTNSIMEVVPVVKIERTAFKAGSITRMLQRKYRTVTQKL